MRRGILRPTWQNCRSYCSAFKAVAARRIAVNMAKLAKDKVAELGDLIAQTRRR
jgi:hypothetical protein